LRYWGHIGKILGKTSPCGTGDIIDPGEVGNFIQVIRGVRLGSDGIHGSISIEHLAGCGRSEANNQDE